MRKFFRHVIRTQPITRDFRTDVDEVSVINPHVEYENTFAYEPNILEDAVLEPDGDLDEYWLYEKTKDVQAHSIFLHLTDKEWERLGIRDSLWGQVRLVDGKIICYGRWHENARYQNSDNYDHPVNQISEMAIGIAHEERHRLGKLTGQPDTTHYHFYGERDGDRWEATPTPREAYNEIEWDNLPELEINQLRRIYLTRLKKYRDLLQARLAQLQKKAEKRKARPEKLQPLVRRKAEQLKDVMEALGYPVRITSGFRTLEEQRRLYEKGRTTGGEIVTNARPGESLHNFGVSVDYVFTETGYEEFEVAEDLTNWQLLGINGEALGFEWGGRWKDFQDKPHFQYTGKYLLEDFITGNVNYEDFL